MANRQEELVNAIEELTGTMKRQSSMTATLGQAIQGSLTSSEGLKAAMLKTGRLQEDKIPGLIKVMSDMPGNISKTIEGVAGFMKEGIGEHSRNFLGVVSKISALGMDNGPFLQLARSMNAKMGMTVEQQTEQLKSLMNLRLLTGQNPELMAKALARQSSTFQEVAGIRGEAFSRNLQDAMMAISQGTGGHVVLEDLMPIVKKLVQGGGEGYAIRGLLAGGKDLNENTTSRELVDMILMAMKTLNTSSMFDSALQKVATGGAWDITGQMFQTSRKAMRDLAGKGGPELQKILDLMKTDLGQTDFGKAQSEDKLLSTKLNRVINQFANVLPDAILKVSKALNGLAPVAAGVAKTLSGYLKTGADLGAGGLTKLIGGVKSLVTPGGTLASLSLGNGAPKGAAMGIASGVGGLATEVGKGLMKFFTEGDGATRIFDAVILFFKEWGYKLPRLFNEVVLNLGNVLNYTFTWVTDKLTIWGMNIVNDLETLVMKATGHFKLTAALLGSTLAEAMDMGFKDKNYGKERNKMRDQWKHGTGEYQGIGRRDYVNHNVRYKDKAGEFNLPEWQSIERSEKEEDIAYLRESVRLLAYFKASFDKDAMKGHTEDINTNIAKIWKWLEESAKELIG